jgi:hypothetical protein
MDSIHGFSPTYTPGSPADILGYQAASMALVTTVTESTAEAIHAYYVTFAKNQKDKLAKQTKKRPHTSRAPKIGPALPPNGAPTRTERSNHGTYPRGAYAVKAEIFNKDFINLSRCLTSAHLALLKCQVCDKTHPRQPERTLHCARHARLHILL